MSFSKALKIFAIKIINKDVEWNNTYTVKTQSTVKPEKEHTFNQVSNNLYKQIRPKTGSDMIIKHYGKMTWDMAIDLAFDNGEYIPNYEQAKALNLHGSWTSTTFEQASTQAKVLGINKHDRIWKTTELPVVTINESNYTPDTVAYRTGDEGDGSTNEAQ